MSARRKKPTRAARERLVKVMADGIQRRVGWFNGWAASPEAERASCKLGAREAIKRLRRAGLEIREVKPKRKQRRAGK